MNDRTIKVDFADESFIIKVPFRFNSLVQALPDRRFRRRHQDWICPASWRVVLAIQPILDESPQSFTPDALEALTRYRKPERSGDLSYPRDFPFRYPPFRHQEEAYEQGYNQDAYALFFEQGLGKTKTALDLNQMWWEADLVETLIIISPVSIRQVWERECAEHLVVPHQVQLLNTKRAPVWEETRSLRILVVGIESFSQGGAFALLMSVLDSLGKCSLVVDESTRIKNHKTTRTERVVELSTFCVKRLILTGTPVTQGVEDLYSQFQVLNPETLALKSFYTFRNRYCEMEAVRGAPPGVKKVVGYKNLDELMELIEPWSLRREKEHCLDLPPKTYITRLSAMTPGQKKAYREMKADLFTTIDGTDIEASMMLEAYLRLQQIAGGFYPHPDDAPNARAIPGKNPKLEELLAVMDEIGNKKAVIWTRFRPELALIAEALRKAGFRVSEFHGGLKEEEKKESVDAFLNGDSQVMIATQQSASFGHTWTIAHHAIYFSMGFSLEEFLQSQDRIHRIGQTVSCTYTLLGCSGTVDTSVIEILMEKKTLADYVSDRLRNGEGFAP